MDVIEILNSLKEIEISEDQKKGGVGRIKGKGFDVDYGYLVKIGIDKRED